MDLGHDPKDPKGIKALWRRNKMIFMHSKNKWGYLQPYALKLQN